MRYMGLNVASAIVDEPRALPTARAVDEVSMIRRSLTLSASSGTRCMVAVEAMTLILARELRGRDTTADAIAPGPVPQGQGQGADRPHRGAGADGAARHPHYHPSDRVPRRPRPLVGGQVIYVNGGIA
jgi:NAD(P)-dependent dehydrogenase (short-subunit alcohol dehydrogenase family)